MTKWVAGKSDYWVKAETAKEAAEAYAEACSNGRGLGLGSLYRECDEDNYDKWLVVNPNGVIFTRDLEQVEVEE